MIPFLDLRAQYQAIKAEIDAAVAAVLEQAAFVGGPHVDGFEHDFAAYVGARHCVGVANGTDAIEIALEALDLPPGSEVIVPANSFIASSEAVTRSGHRVVFGDVDPATSTLDPADVARRLTANTRAIVAVHLYGHPCDMDALGDLARQHGLQLIEDCAQAHGAEYRGRRVGTFGVAGTYSFYPGKNLGAYGDAGAIVCQDEAYARRCRMIANHGRIAKYDHEFEGRNSRLDSLQAAVLSVKLRHLDQWVAVRNQVAAAYRSGLQALSWLTLPAQRPEVRHAYHLFVVRCARRDALQQHLQARGIQTGIHYPIALPRLRAYRYLGQDNTTPVANAQAGQLLSLPMGEHLAPVDVDAVVKALRVYRNGGL